MTSIDARFHRRITAFVIVAAAAAAWTVGVLALAGVLR